MEQPNAHYTEGQVVRHLASHNRYQEYRITGVRWDPTAMMGAGCYIYTVDFREWADSRMSQETGSKEGWEVAEVTLPVHNQVSWVSVES